jgi:hypothetical protein
MNAVLGRDPALQTILTAGPDELPVVTRLLPLALTPKHTSGRRQEGPCDAAEPTHGIVRSRPDRQNPPYLVLGTTALSRLGKNLSVPETEHLRANHTDKKQREK